MDWFATLVGGTRGRLLGLLRRSRRSIAELAGSVGVSDNAVRGHLTALQRDGLVEPAGVQRDTGGKPAQLYDLTREAEELFPKAYAAVLNGLLAELEEREGRERAVELLRAVGDRVADAAAQADGGVAPGLEARVVASASALRSLGADLEVERADGAWVLRGYGCPLASVVEAHPEACELARALVERMVERPVRECCDRGGRPRCRFEVAR